jgi:hypothetical protein
MDLAKYCVNAVLAEGRSVRAVAASTGRSKSWVTLKRRPKAPANLTSAVLGDQIVAWPERLAKTVSTPEPGRAPGA